MKVLFIALSASLSMLLSSITVEAFAGTDPHTNSQVDMIWGAKIPTRDGVKLNATVFKPKASSEPLPVIFTLTPYIADSYEDRAKYFATHGYVFALVDVRGRGNSEGHFEPFANEGRDGYDVVEWLGRQPWSNGKVAMWGGSYAGFDQWTTLKELPPHLATIVPAAAACAGTDFPFNKNIFSSYLIQWLTFTSGVTPNLRLFGDQSFWIDKFHELYVKNLPFSEIDKIAGNTSTHFQDWLRHPVPDAYWEAMDPSVDQYRRIDVPILTITGHYDGDQPGAMQYYRMHMQYGSDSAKDKHYLIVGPWDHSGTRTPTKEVGGLTFGDASMLDLNSLHKQWYDWTMKSGVKPEFLKKHIAYYLVGADEWKYADSLETIANAKQVLYLDSSDGHANDVMHSGTLRETKPSQSQPDGYTYDPLDTRAGDLELHPSPNELTDETPALNLFGAGLVYHTEPFIHDTEVTGYLKFVAWISMDVPDTDFRVTVYEITEHGGSVMLTEDMLRARYRESPKQGKLVKSGEINRYEFNAFMFFSRRIAKGSRLRLILRAPNSIQLEKNYNGGGVVSEESGKDARTAHVKLYHDGQHASYLELPIVNGAANAQR
jgi:putative CocE/NonD family hydrolase